MSMGSLSSKNMFIFKFGAPTVRNPIISLQRPLLSRPCILPSVFRVMFHSLKCFLSAHCYNRELTIPLSRSPSLSLCWFSHKSNRITTHCSAKDRDWRGRQEDRLKRGGREREGNEEYKLKNRMRCRCTPNLKPLGVTGLGYLRSDIEVCLALCQLLY